MLYGTELVWWNLRLTRSPAFTAIGCVVSEQLLLLLFVVTVHVIDVWPEASMFASEVPLNTVIVVLSEPGVL